MDYIACNNTVIPKGKLVLVKLKCPGETVHGEKPYRRKALHFLAPMEKSPTLVFQTVWRKGLHRSKTPTCFKRPTHVFHTMEKGPT